MSRTLDTQFEDLNRDMKEQIHHFHSKAEGSLGLSEKLDEFGGINMAPSSNRGCVVGEKNDCDPLGEEQLPYGQPVPVNNFEETESSPLSSIPSTRSSSLRFPTPYTPWCLQDPNLHY